MDSFTKTLVTALRWNMERSWYTLLGSIAGNFHAACGFVSTSSMSAWFILCDLFRENIDSKLFTGLLPEVLACSTFLISLKDTERESILSITIFTQQRRDFSLMSFNTKGLDRLLAYSSGKD
jgi:hypothetical protein